MQSQNNNKKAQLKSLNLDVSGELKSSLMKNSVLNISKRTLKFKVRRIKTPKSRLMDCGKAKAEIFMLSGSVLSLIPYSKSHTMCSTCFTAKTRKSSSELYRKE